MEEKFRSILANLVNKTTKRVVYPTEKELVEICDAVQLNLIMEKNVIVFVIF